MQQIRATMADEEAEEERLIGEPLAAAADRINACAQALDTLVSKRQRDLVASTVADLEANVLKITVIGQIKAGKSSLINALTGQPGLLPADANPWTSAITRMHFQHAPAAPYRMTFRFFSEEEWSDIIEGRGPVAAIMERLGSDAERAELERLLGLVLDRAEERLGAGYRRLLGKRHRFKTISQDILERYVCGNDDSSVGPSPVAPGRYADITKLADIDLDQGPFAYPATVTDTPGVNDPFLIRGDVTNHYLEDTDLCIVVLNAQQALAMADVDLLRLLHGLHRNRIVVFVNRIDLLNDVIGDRDKVLASVRQKLEQTFPESAIPVIGGSARWGEQADLFEPADFKALATPALGALAARLGVIAEADIGRWREGRPPDPALMRRALWRCSGLSELRAAISDLLVAGPGRHVARRASVALQAVIHSAESANKNGLSAIIAMAEAVTGDGKVVMRQLAQLQKDFKGLEELGGSLAQTKQVFAHDINLMQTIGLQNLGFQLQATVEKFADAEVASLEAASADKAPPSRWHCDINPLRQSLARQFLAQYRLLSDRLLELQELSTARAGDLLNKAVPGYPLEIGYRQPHLIDPSPSISALGQVLALDIGLPWFDWWKRWRQSGRAAEVLKRLILNELEPVIEQLMATARAGLEPHTEEAVERFDDELNATMTILRDRKRRFMKVYVSMLEKRGDRSPEDLLRQYRASAKSLRLRLARLGKIREQLDEALETLEADRNRPGS